MSVPAILLPTAALLMGIGILLFAIFMPKQTREPAQRGDRRRSPFGEPWRETFSEALDRKDARIEELEREVERLQTINDNREAMLKHWELNQRVLQGHMTTEQMRAELAQAHPGQYGNLA